MHSAILGTGGAFCAADESVPYGPEIGFPFVGNAFMHSAVSEQAVHFAQRMNPFPTRTFLRHSAGQFPGGEGYPMLNGQPVVFAEQRCHRNGRIGQHIHGEGHKPH